MTIRFGRTTCRPPLSHDVGETLAAMFALVAVTNDVLTMLRKSFFCAHPNKVTGVVLVAPVAVMVRTGYHATLFSEYEYSTMFVDGIGVIVLGVTVTAAPLLVALIENLAEEANA